VDRIEIIFGPGGTLWGANAVQGIINIITKDARDTQGALVTVGGGSELQGLAGFRYGAKAGQDSYYRMYGKFSSRDAAFHPDGRNFDDWRMGRAGFRADWTLSRDRTLTLQGDLYKGLLGQRTAITAYSPPFTTAVEDNAEVSGGNVLGRWGGPLGDGADFRAQVYYDRTNRREPAFQEGRDTVDLDFQHHIYPIKRQEFVWGFGYRATSGDTHSVSTTRFVPDRRTDHLVSGFLQDDIELVSDRLRLIVGSKFERNGYSGFENQPSGRVIWTPSPSHTLLLSAARAVRTPSRVEHDLELTVLLQPTAPAAFLRLTPNKEFQSEKLVAYEMGYRVRPASRLYVTFSAFFNDYADLVSNEVRTPFFEVEPSPPHVVLPLIWGNGLGGHAHGMELNSDWRVTNWWRLNSNYSYLRINLKKDPGSLDSSTEGMMEGSSPRHQVSLQSSINLEPSLEFDWIFRVVSGLPSLRIPSYVTSNVRMGWRPYGNWELSVVGQNLHQPRHAEFSGGVQIERAVYGKMTWQW
jgi:iron complex outermembrane receptor protein